MFDDHGQPDPRSAVRRCPPKCIGLESLPDVGDTLQVVTDTAKAKQIVIYRESKAREVAMSKTNRITLEQLHDQLKEGETKELNIILKTDVGGTAEVLDGHAAEAFERQGQDSRAALGRGRDHRNGRAAGFGLQRDHRGLQRPAGAQRAGHRGAGKGRHPAAHDHLRAGGRDQARHDRAAGAGVQGSLQRPGQVREVFRISKVGTVAGCMVERRRAHAQQPDTPAARQRGGATPARSNRSSASRTTRAK